MLFKKENGFSLVEVMILFVVMSAILAASISVVSRRSFSPPIKIARGAYICYMDDSGNLHEEEFNKSVQTVSKTLSAGQSCSFKPKPQASAYQITLIGAGAGGYNRASLSNSLIADDTIKYTMDKGFLNSNGDELENPTWDKQAVSVASDGTTTTVGRVTDDDLWSYYNGQDLTVATKAPDGQEGHKITACFLTKDKCGCFESDTSEVLLNYTDVKNSKSVNALVSFNDIYNELVTNAVEYDCQPNGNCKYHFAPGYTVTDAQTRTALDVTEFHGKTENDMPSQRDVCEGCNAMANHQNLSWGGKWYCGCKDDTVDGQAGGLGGYISKTHTLSSSSLTGAYALDGSSSQYQNVLKKFAENMAVGQCSETGDSSSDCTFEALSEQLQTPTGGSTLDLRYTTNQSGCEQKNGDTYCLAANGNDVAHRVAVKYPFPVASDSATTYNIHFQTKTAKGGNGAIVKFLGAGNSNKQDQGSYRWEKLNFTDRSSFKDSDDNSQYKTVEAAAVVSQTPVYSYRPMLEFVSNLTHRNYFYGQPGGDGQQLVNVRARMKGECTMTIGKAGSVHKGNDTNEFRNYVDTGIGNTTISCTDGYHATATGGQPSAELNTLDYVYSFANKNLTHFDVIQNAYSNYKEPVALQLLRTHGLSSNANFGQGGKGVTMKDKCIMPKGTFKVYRSNQYSPSDGRQVISSDNYGNPECYDDTNEFGTNLGGASMGADGNLTSTYLEIYAAENGQNGAVIITY